MQIKYEQLTAQKKKRLLQIVTERNTFKEFQDPELEANRYLNKKARTPRAWRTVIYLSMLSIDSSRKKLGLKPIHFPET